MLLPIFVSNQFFDVMKDKIIAALKTKYQRFGLSNEAVDRIASAKEKTVTKEEDIETAIADVETMELIANEVQKSADRERRSRSDLQKSFDDYKKLHPETKPQEEEKDDPNKAILDKLIALEAKLNAQEKAEKQKATYASVIASAKQNGCTDERGLDLTQRLFSLKDEESAEDAATRFKTEYDATMKKYFGDGAVPPKGSGNAPSTDAEYAKMLEGFAESKGLVEKKTES